MKRIGGLMPWVYSFSTLKLAFKNASKGKKDRASVARFAMDLEPELFRLQRELVSGTWHPGGFSYFTIRDPKERTISVAPFRDRVVHHALIHVMAPYLERRFDFDSYGCRKRKGMDRALDRARHFAKNFPYCLKMDIQKFFSSVDPSRLKQQLRRIFKDRDLLNVLDLIIDSADEGLPLGNLTSQWMANYYLTFFDRFLRERTEACGQVRYMDDILVFGRTKADLLTLLPEIRRFLDLRLGLMLKERMTHIYPTGSGIPFLGFRVLPQHLRIRRETWKRYRMRVSRKEWEYRTGRCTIEELAESIQSMTSHLKRGETSSLRKYYFSRKQAVEW